MKNKVMALILTAILVGMAILISVMAWQVGAGMASDRAERDRIAAQKVVGDALRDADQAKWNAQIEASKR